MQPDPSFAEFVSVRWSVLYRLAVLLAGPEEADDLVEEALARALGTWEGLQEAGSAEEHVKERLAHDAAAAAPGGSEVAATARAGDGLWLRVAALPPRQRVVVVLECYELLATSDIARALGCRPDVVETESALAFGLLGATSAEVAAELERAANDVPVPLPPIDAVLARWRRDRRRRAGSALRWTAGVAATLLVGSAVATALQHRGAGPDPDATPSTQVHIPRELDDLPEGKPPQTAYADQNALHFSGDRSIVLPEDPTAIVRGPSRLYVSFASGTIVRVDTAPLQVTLVTQSAVGPVVTDALGRFVAWVKGPLARPVVVIRPTESVRSVATGWEASFQACCTDQLEIVGLTPSGDLVASVPSELRAWLWRAPGNFPGDAPGPEELEGVGNGVVRQVTPGELVVQYPPTHFAVGSVEDLSFLAEEDLVARDADFTDPLGERIVYADRAGEIHVGHRNPGFGRDRTRDLRLWLPLLATGFAALTWEDKDHVLLDVTDDSLPQGALARCHTGTGACELAVRFEGAHVVAQ